MQLDNMMFFHHKFFTFLYLNEIITNVKQLVNCIILFLDSARIQYQFALKKHENVQFDSDKNKSLTFSEIIEIYFYHF